MAAIALLARRLVDPPLPTQRPSFDVLGAVLSAVGLFFVVFGILQTGTYGWFTAKQDFRIGDTVVISQGGISPVWLFVAIGVVILLAFFVHVRSREKAGRTPLVSVSLFRNRTSNLGLLTQNLQWLVLHGLVVRDLGLPAAGTGILRDRDRARPPTGHDRRPARLGGRAAHGRPALPAPAHPDGFRGHGRRLRPLWRWSASIRRPSGPSSRGCS